MAEMPHFRPPIVARVRKKIGNEGGPGSVCVVLSPLLLSEWIVVVIFGKSAVKRASFLTGRRMKAKQEERKGREREKER